jgi:hypothetical protein
LTAQVDAYLQVAKIVRDGHDQGLTPAAIFTQIEAVTGPVRGPAPPPPPGGRGDFHQDKLRNLAMQIAMMRRQAMGDDQVVYSLMSWTETPLPKFHKL